MTGCRRRNNTSNSTPASRRLRGSLKLNEETTLKEKVTNSPLLKRFKSNNSITITTTTTTTPKTSNNNNTKIQTPTPTSVPSSKPPTSSSKKKYDWEEYTNYATRDIPLFNCKTDVTFLNRSYGEGTDGIVQAAKIKHTYIVALKQHKPSPHAHMQGLVERYWLRKVRHVPYFVQCLGSCDGYNCVCIALEVMDCKLSDLARSRKKRLGNGDFSPSEIHHILSRVCLGMIYMHRTLKVAHGDVAFRNILVRAIPGEEQLEVKLSDFGRIRVVSDEPTSDVIEEDVSFYQNADVGAFGRDVLYRLVVGERLPERLVSQKTIGHPGLVDDFVTKSSVSEEKLGKYANLFYRCVGWGIRPTFQEIYDHLDDLAYFNVGENPMFTLKYSAPCINDENEAVVVGSSNNINTCSPRAALAIKKKSNSVSSKKRGREKSMKVQSHKRTTLTMKLLTKQMAAAVRNNNNNK